MAEKMSVRPSGLRRDGSPMHAVPKFTTGGRDMPMRMKFSMSSILRIGAVALLPWFGLLCSPAPVHAQNPSPDDMKGKTAGQYYKNLLVLKDLPATDLHPAMEYITVSLGVGCGYCHNPQHFDSDEKDTKKTARNMMKMMFAIDDTVFKGRREVTCYTCHRGAAIGASSILPPGEKASTEPPSVQLFPSCAVRNLALDLTMSPIHDGDSGAAPANPPPLPPPPPGPQMQPLSADMVGKTAGQYYKNLQVLKDIPATDLHPAMEYITVALGVGCTYCHMGGGHFESDDKNTKRTARNMMKMMFALDDTVFSEHREITCYTCHRGGSIAIAGALPVGEKASTEPPPAQAFPLIQVRNISLDSSMGPVRSANPSALPAQGRPAGASAAPAGGLPAFDDLLNKYQQALGGTSAIQKATSLSEKGTVEMAVPQPPGTPPGPPNIGHPAAEIYRRAPDKALVTIHLPANPSLEGFDGEKAWLSTSPAFVREETGGERAAVEEWAEFIPAMKFKESHSDIHVDAIEKVGDRDAYRVSGFKNDGFGLDRLYFDVQTGLLLQSTTSMNSVLGSYPLATKFEDYRDVNGLKVPFTVHELSPEGDKTFKWDQVDLNAPVDDSRFTQPLPKAPPPAR